MVFLMSLWIVVYIVAQKLPKIFDEINLSGQKAPSFNFKINNEFIDKFDKKTAVMLEKLLRKSHLVIMKLDNFVAKHLDSISIRGKKATSKPQDIIQSVSEKEQPESESEIKD